MTSSPIALDTPGQIGIRVMATDPGTGPNHINPLSVTNTFFIDVQPPNSPPFAVDDTYSTFENVGVTAVLSTGVLHNDTDPNLDPFTGAVVDRADQRDADVPRERDLRLCPEQELRRSGLLHLPGH